MKTVKGITSIIQTVHISPSGFDRTSYTFSNPPPPVSVVFQLTDDLDQAKVTLEGRSISMEINLSRAENNTEVPVILVSIGTYNINLPPAEENMGISGTTSGTIDVSGTQAP